MSSSVHYIRLSMSVKMNKYEVYFRMLKVMEACNAFVSK